MEQPLHRQIINNKLYTVYDDGEGFWQFLNDLDFPEEEKNDYISKFERYQIGSYLVERSKKCECCNQWVIEDAVGGIICEDYEEAITQYREDYNA